MTSPLSLRGAKAPKQSLGEILNPKHEILNNIEIQKSKAKNQNDNSKRKIFNLCSVILHFYFCILKGFEAERLWDLEFSQWDCRLALGGDKPRPYELKGIQRRQIEMV
jgi:hypothetical protein